MSYRSSWGNIRPRISRRFTTLEGLREISTGFYTTSAFGVRVFSIQRQFDADRYEDDRTSWTQTSRADSVIIQAEKSPSLPISADFDEEKRISVIPEPPYHVFSKKQKWSVVVMIGVAGLFSGLSSNIYFPALDSIAKVGYCIRCTRTSLIIADIS